MCVWDTRLNCEIIGVVASALQGKVGCRFWDLRVGGLGSGLRFGVGFLVFGIP